MTASPTASYAAQCKPRLDGRHLRQAVHALGWALQASTDALVRPATSVVGRELPVLRCVLKSTKLETIRAI